MFSLKRRALAPLAWLRALRRAGAVAPAGPLRGPVPLIPCTLWGHPAPEGHGQPHDTGLDLLLRGHQSGGRKGGAPARAGAGCRAR